MPLLKHNNQSISNVTSFPLVPSGSPTLLATATASSSASLSFNSTYINGDYQIYKFVLVNCHPQTDGVKLEFNLSTDNGSNYNVTKTTTLFDAYHRENDSSVGVGYNSSQDLAQSTSNQNLTPEIELSNADDASASGTLTLFNPSSTTYVKHFMYVGNHMSSTPPSWSVNTYMAGYGNTTTAVNAVRFIMNSGNIDAGTIKLYGLGAN